MRVRATLRADAWRRPPEADAVSLFSNCGAGDLGFAAAGFRFRVMAELDAAAPETAKDPKRPLHFVPVWPDRQRRMVAAIPSGSGASAWQNTDCAACGAGDADTGTVEWDSALPAAGGEGRGRPPNRPESPPPPDFLRGSVAGGRLSSDPPETRTRLRGPTFAP